LSKPATPIAVPIEQIATRIFIVRGQKGILDTDLASLYGVSTKRFNEAVKRNLAKFPPDFMFALTEDEWSALRSQFATLNPEKGGRGKHRKYLPYVFTEHGALMASMVLNSPRAVEMSVYVVRAFVQLRETLASHAELARQLRALEVRMLKKFATHDAAINDILDTLRQLTAPPAAPKRPIGFVIEEPKAGGTKARGGVGPSTAKEAVKREPRKRRQT
jgi:hypothetical protein